MLATSCDTLVALGPVTAGGATIFAKNSDRPPTECQPLFAAPRLTHPAGAVLRCQYVEIPQAPETLALLGSRPWWLWGFEHGVNECRVAIGNEAVHARELPGASGLLGMDLVRLGLERGRTAAEAKRIITELLERHGQGGSARYGEDSRYHNSFLIADPAEAWVLETCGPHWAAKRIRHRAAISNVYTLQDDWDEISGGAGAYARERGWWTAAGRFRLGEAVENPAVRYRGEARLKASCKFLASEGRPGVADFMRHLRDHYDGGTVHRPGRRDGDPLGWSVCMHPGPGVSATAAGMVVELPADTRQPLVAWCAMTTPCTSVFLPVPVGVPLPAALTLGTGEPDPASAWWRLQQLGEAVQRDPERRTPVVQSAWREWEAALIAEQARDPNRARAQLGARLEQLLTRADTLRADLG